MANFSSNELKVHSISTSFEIYFYNLLEDYTNTDSLSHKYNEGSSYKTMEDLGLFPYYKFSSVDTGVLSSANLQSYTFTNGIKNLDGSFSLTIKEDTRELLPGETYFMDQVHQLDVVKIVENGYVAFWGVVRTISFGATAGAMNKVITISGMSAAGLLNMFNISTDMASMQAIMNVAENGKIASRIANLFNQKEEKNGKLVPKPVEVKEVFRIVYLALHYVAKGHKYNSKTGEWDPEEDKSKQQFASFKIQRIFRYIFGVAHDDVGLTLNYDTEKYTKPVEFLDCDVTMRYQLATNLFNMSEVNIVSYFKGILPEILYEFFHEMDENDQPKIIIRQAPFTKEGWKNLGVSYEIDPSTITDYTLTQTDANIFTAFFAYPAGQSGQRDLYRYMTGKNDTAADKKNNTVQKVDDKLLHLYGYIPLDAAFLGYKPDSVTTDNQIEISEKMSSDLGYMYKNLKDYWSGDVTFVNLMDNEDSEFYKQYAYDVENKQILTKPVAIKKTNIPRIGTKVKLCGMEFYVTDKTHSWRYGEPCKVNLRLERGGKYNEDGFVEPVEYASNELDAKIKKYNPASISRTWSELLTKE